MKKITIIVVALIAFFSASLNSRAATNYIYLGEEIDGIRVHMKTNTKNFSMAMEKIINRNTGELLYCIEPGIHLYDGNYEKTTNIDTIKETITKEEWEYLKILTYYGYGYQNRTDLKWYVITQFMVWNYLIRDEGEIYFVNEFDVKKELYESEMNEILSDIKSHDVIPSIASKTFMGESIDIRSGKETVLEDKNKVLAKFDVECNDVHATLKKDGNNLIFKSNSTGDVSIYFNYITDVRKDGMYFYKKSSQTVISRNKEFPLLYLNAHMTLPSVTLIKESADESNLSLKGAIYEIYREDNSLYKTITLDHEGVGVIKNIYPGTYYLKEKIAPYGYQLNKEETPFTVTTEDITLNVKDELIQKEVIIEKYLEDFDKNLSLEKDATFEIYEKTTNKLLNKFKTGADGKYTLNLVYGEYILKQISGTTGYLNSEDLEFSVNEESNSRIILKNKEIVGSLEIKKIDQETNELINTPVTFRIKNTKTNEYLKVDGNYKFTINNGFKRIDNIPYGEYEIEEVNAPMGYVKGKNKRFKIKEEGITVYSDISNKKIYGSLEIKKIDQETQELIKLPVIFSIKNIKTNEYLKVGNDYYFTIDSGLIRIDNIPYGEYEIEEINSPMGYVKGEKQIFTIKEDKKTITMNILNKKIMGSLEIRKVDLNTKELIMDPATFKIKDLKSDKYLKINGTELIKTESGIIKIENIPFGFYELIEVEAPVNYFKKDNISFLIDYDGASITLEVANQKKTGALVIEKLDLDSKKPLENVLFGIYKEDGSLIKEDKTNELGLIEVTDLEVGNYYIKELLSIDNYELNTEEIKVEIKDNIKSTVTVTNRFLIEVPKTSTKEFLVSFNISTVLLLIGYILCYEKNYN